jgi:hypothetical protein
MTKNPGDQRHESAAGRKKPYQKPEIRQVALRPEEAVLGSCKSSTAGGPAQLHCNSTSSCHNIAS